MDIYEKTIEDKLAEIDNACNCIECGRTFEQQTDLELCEDCEEKFDLEKLWKMHDNNELDALDFNESKTLRDKFRVV